MVIYCSKKLEALLGPLPSKILASDASVLGDWTGHLFTCNRKKSLIFMNNKAGYSILFLNVSKKGLRDFSTQFKEKLLQQLDTDIKLTEGQEVNIRYELGNVELSKSNNNRSVLAAINHHINHLQHVAIRDGGIENCNEIREANILNNYPMTTNVELKKLQGKRYFIATDLIKEILR